jgi:hypothetical protein
MSERFETALFNAQHGHTVLRDLWAWLKPLLLSERRYRIEVYPETRSTAQNALLHSRIGDIAKQLQWAGKQRDPDTWKRLLTAAWLRARGESVELLPAIDGHGVDVVFRRTSTLTVAECVELSDYILAWGDGEGVQWCRASLGRDWPDEVLSAA